MYSSYTEGLNFIYWSSCKKQFVCEHSTYNETVPDRNEVALGNNEIPIMKHSQVVMKWPQVIMKYP